MRHPGRFLIASCVSAALLACAGTGGPVVPAPAPQSPLARPQGADGHYAQGRAHHAALRYAEAQQAYLAALALEPRHLNARNGLAVLYAGQGDYPQAIELWRELLRESGPAIAPQQAFLLANLGYAYLLDGQPEAALTVLEQACLLDPLKAQSWEHLALALERLGQDQRAALMRRQAASLRAHDIGRDYAALAPPGAVAASPRVPAPVSAPVSQAALPRPATAWPEELERTELSQDGPGLVQLRRVGVPQAGEGRAVAPAPAAPAAPGAPARVAISNGNGSRGLARALARSVDSGQLRVVRVSTLHFKVRRSRVEYRQEQQEQAARALAQRLGLDLRSACGDCRKADLRIVLGRDFREPGQGQLE